jgi:hypothetical protein
MDPEEGKLEVGCRIHVTAHEHAALGPELGVVASEWDEPEV